MSDPCEHPTVASSAAVDRPTNGEGEAADARVPAHGFDAREFAREGLAARGMTEGEFDAFVAAIMAACDDYRGEYPSGERTRTGEGIGPVGRAAFRTAADAVLEAVAGHVVTAEERGYRDGMIPLIVAREAAAPSGDPTLSALRGRILVGYHQAGIATFGPDREATLWRWASELAGVVPVRIARDEAGGDP